MNNGINLNALSRPYKVEVFGLQDDFIGTLQPYTDSSIRQLTSPQITLSTDGTSSFTFQLPFYIKLAGEEKKENPLWKEAERGLLAENIRILKVFIKRPNKDLILPFIIDKINESRDSNYQVYKEVTCSGLAAAELGKIGYKLSLTSETVELDKTFDSSIEPTIDYWLDQVFPNEKIQATRMVDALEKVLKLPELLQSIRFNNFADKKSQLIESLYSLKNYNESMINDILEILQTNLENSQTTGSDDSAWDIINSAALFSYNLTPLLNNINTLLTVEFPQSQDTTPTGDDIAVQREKDLQLYTSLMGNSSSDDTTISIIDTTSINFINDLTKIKYWHESGANLIYTTLNDSINGLKANWSDIAALLNDTSIENPYLSLSDEQRAQSKLNLSTLLSSIKNKLQLKDGFIFKWLTPWSYEIRMDWSGYTGKRDSNKVYETPYVSNWDINELNEFVPSSVIESKEKARFIDCTNSNKYNITQDIAEAFEVFCDYEYEVDQNGIIKEIVYEEDDKVYTGRRVVFYNEMIDKKRAFSLNYEKNLNSFSREIDSSEIYTKLYVTDIDAENMASSVVSIADTPSNPLMDDFILDFQYLEETGKINDFQINYIQQYQVELAKINRRLKMLLSMITKLDADITTITEMKIGDAKAKINAAKEQITDYTARIMNTEDKRVEESLSIYATDESKNIAAHWHSYTFTVEGIETNSIKIYTNSTHTTAIYTGATTTQTINKISEIKTDATGQKTMYIKYDTGTTFAKTIYFYHNQSSSQYYLTFAYNPVNKYRLLLQQANSIKVKNEQLLTNLIKEYNVLKNQLLETNIEVNQLNERKEELNNDLHLYLGPALREGYYNPESYEDPGEKHSFEVQAVNNSLSNISTTDSACRFYWDDTPREGELESTYTLGVGGEISVNPSEELPEGEVIEDASGEEGRYFLNIANQINDADLQLYFNNYCEEVYINFIPKNIKIEYSSAIIFGKGTYYFTYFGKNYYFTLPSQASNVTSLELINFSPYNSSSSYGQVHINNNNTNISITTTYTGQWTDLHYYDFNIESQSLIFYPSSGYQYGFVKQHNPSSNLILPAVIFLDEQSEFTSHLLQNETFNSKYNLLFIYNNQIIEQLSNYSLQTLSTAAQLEENNETTYQIVYPRIDIGIDNVNYYSDNFTIGQSNNNTTYTSLDNNYAYTVVLEELQPLITLKVSDYLGLGNILNSWFQVHYIISRANEMLYLDAKKVAHENSQPKYTYNVGVANIPKDINQLLLGDLVYINDYTLNAYRVQGYISEIHLSLDAPLEDNFTIANYKTKFEDLFTQVSATSEAVALSKRTYDNAASKFDATGLIVGDILQQSFNDNKISFTSSLSKISIDDTGGMIIQSADKIGVPTGPITELIDYPAESSGNLLRSAPLRANRTMAFAAAPAEESPLVGTSIAERLPTGQIALRSGGIFCSNSVDENNEPVWTAAITPVGINATTITTGVLNTENIKIYSGTDVRFQWNANGIFAYSADTSDNINYSSYVRYSNEGLQIVQDSNEIAHFSSDKILLSAQDGAVTLDTDNGLQVFQGENRVVLLGKQSYVDSENNVYDTYGLHLFNIPKPEEAQEEIFYVDNSGVLNIKGTIVANSGNIGGWEITGSGLTYSNGTFELSPTNGITTPYFKATATGITLGQGSITGNLTLGNKIVIDGENGSIQTNPFISGSTGWRISQDGSGEFNNLNIRGKIQSSVFEYNHINSIGGDLYISPSLYLEQAGKIQIESSETTPVITTYSCVWPIQQPTEISQENGDIVAIKMNDRIWNKGEKIKLDLYLTTNNQDNTITSSYFHDLIGTISFMAENDTNYFLIATIDNVPAGWGDWMQGLDIVPGALLVLFGDDTHYNGIYLSANSSNGPYLDVYSSDTSATIINKPQVRLGKLDGINDETFRSGEVKGYGLYAQNAYIRGEFALPNGGLTNSTMYPIGNTHHIIFWAGSLSANASGNYSAPFYIANDGSMYANNGYFRGTIEAENGTFSGELGVVKLILNKDNKEEQEKDNSFSVKYRQNGTDIDLLNISKNGLSIQLNDFNINMNSRDANGNNISIVSIQQSGLKARQGNIDNIITGNISFDNNIIIEKAQYITTVTVGNNSVNQTDYCGLDFSTKKR